MQRLARILITPVLAALLAGCATEPIVSTTPSPTFGSEAEAFAAAEATYRAYVDALNRVDLADPKTFEAVYEWTTGEADEGLRKMMSQMHADGWKVSGISVPALVSPMTWKSVEASLAVCLDVSDVDVFDPSGVSMVSPSRGAVQTMVVHVEASTRSSTGALVSAVAGRMDGPACEG